MKLGYQWIIADRLAINPDAGIGLKVNMLSDPIALSGFRGVSKQILATGFFLNFGLKIGYPF